jgi:UDP-N-acetylglucosamine transferase subunit ALG13
MVGMHDIGFDRLIAEIDAIAKRKPNWEFLVQKGYSQFKLRHVNYYDFKPGLEDDIAWADLIVSHGSVCILDVLKAGKKLIVVPRLALNKEAMNDHQLDWARHFSKRFEFPIIVEVNDLEKVISEKIKEDAKMPVIFKPTGLFDELRKYLGSVNSKL